MTSLDDIILPIIPWDETEHESNPIYAMARTLQKSLKRFKYETPFFKKILGEITREHDPKIFLSESPLNPYSLIKKNYFGAEAVISWNLNLAILGKRVEDSSNSSTLIPIHYATSVFDSNISLPTDITQTVLKEGPKFINNFKGDRQDLVKGYHLVGGVGENLLLHLYQSGKVGFSESQQQLFSLFIEHIHETFDFLKSSKIDNLTGLINQNTYPKLFYDNSQKFTKKGENYSIVMIDIDHFKQFNDTYGHPIGDKVLEVFGSIINESIRGEDLAARYGGEECILLLKGGLDAAKKVTERIKKRIQDYEFKTKQGDLIKKPITASMGIYSTELGYEELLRKDYSPQERFNVGLALSDTILYKAKENGRNRIEIYPIIPINP